MANGDDWKSRDLADCAKKRLVSAKQLENIDRTAATYIAGIACESMFRSLRYKNKRTHNSGHSIIDLARECGYFDVIPFELKAEVNAKLKVLKDYWWNELRYANENHQLRKYLNTNVFPKRKNYNNFDEDLKMVYQNVYAAVEFLIKKGVEHAGI